MTPDPVATSPSPGRTPAQTNAAPLAASGRPGPSMPTGYLVRETYDLGRGRVLEPGVELTVAGVRGRVRFVQHVTGPAGAEWLDVITVRSGHARSVRPNAVRTVHRGSPVRP